MYLCIIHYYKCINYTFIYNHFSFLVFVLDVEWWCVCVFGFFFPDIVKGYVHFIVFPGDRVGREHTFQCQRHKRHGFYPLGQKDLFQKGNHLQYSCLENPMDRGAYQATVHGVTKSQTRLKKQLNTHSSNSLRVTDMWAFWGVFSSIS